jgi:hypothetical protein
MNEVYKDNEVCQKVSSNFSSCVLSLYLVQLANTSLFFSFSPCL